MLLADRDLDMSKGKKGRTADRYIEALINDLNESGDGEALGNEPIDVAHKDVARGVNSEDIGEDPNDEAKTAALPDGLDIKDISPKSKNHASRVMEEQSVTIPLPKDSGHSNHSLHHSSPSDIVHSDRTQPMAKGLGGGSNRESSIKVSVGMGRSAGRAPGSVAGQQSESALQQAASLDLAQARINELTLEKERLEEEVRLLVSAGSIAKRQEDEMKAKLYEGERIKNDVMATAELEVKILKESLMDKDRELNKLKKKLDEMDGRMHTDLRKVRVRERELENRLELARMEKTALIRNKDETLLDLKRKLEDQASSLELEKHKAAELQKKIEAQQDQLGRTVRALRMALTNLESTDSTSGQLVPLKKAD
jgi:hypothetical protein